jgi:hypothetical protein
MSLARRSRATSLIALATLGMALAAAAPAAAASMPPTPIDLFNTYLPCSTDVTSPDYLNSFGGVILEGRSLDTNPADGLTIAEQFKLWPISDPTQVTTQSNNFVVTPFEGSVTVPAADFTDGQTYAWEAEAVAPSGSSAWSAPCYFTVDSSPPSSPPTISSPNYPSGQLDQGGTPVQFIFGANGVSDVVGYAFSWTGVLPVPVTARIGPYGVPQPNDPFADTKDFVRASSLGGSATMSVLPPTPTGPNTLTVASLDRAYNESSVATYRFVIKASYPTLTPLVPSPKFGQQMEFLVRPDPSLQAISPAVSYTVQIVNSTQQTFTVKPSADGIAEVAFNLDGASGDSITVTSTSANGWVSGGAFWSTFFDTTPTVSSDIYLEGQTSGGAGIPGTFTFAPKVKGIVSYTYSVNGDPPVTVPAGPDGTAQITFTPDQSGGFYDLNVYGTTRDGVQLAAYDYIFFTN